MSKRILLRDLEPGRFYYIQARATNGEQSSQWSQLWDLETTSDIMPPAAPSGLSWAVEGTAFKAVWTGPTTNQDGSELRDFKDFQVKLYSPAAPGTVATYYTTAARFDFPFETNVNALGTPRAEVTIEVRARDNTGNLSSAVTADATNPPPSDVTGFTATGIADSIALKWDANTDDDLKYYQVYHGLSAGTEDTLVYTGLTTAFVFDTISTNPQYFKIYAVDVFNSQSVTGATANATAKSSLAVDNTPPDSPTGVTVSSALDSSDTSGGTAYIDVSWTGVADTDLQNYSVRYSTGTDWQYIDVPEGEVATRINGLKPNTAYNVAVAAVDFAGNSSAYANAGTYPITTAQDTTAPSAPTGLTVGAGITTITALWDENTEGDVVGAKGYYEIQLDTANTFDTVNLVSKQTSGTIISFSNLTSNTTYYVRLRAVDASGNPGAYCTEVSAVPRYIDNSDIDAGTINGDRIIAASINGDRMVANTLDANLIKANSTFTEDLYVGSTFTMATTGIMQSENYSSGVAGWRLTNDTLEINDGTIKAASLDIQEGGNILHPAYADFEFVSTWYDDKFFVFNDGGTTTATISDATDVAGKYNTQCLKHSWTGSGTFSRVYQSTDSTSYNLNVESDTDYIFSAYFYVKSGAGAKTVGLAGKLADGTFVQPGGTSNVIPDTGVWTRVSGAFNTGSNNSMLTYLSLYTSGDVYVDGLQIERQLTSSTTPSQWKPPGNTSIDGSIIRTGSIQSTASADGLSGQPAWSINMQGNAQLGDANVRGRLVVGDPNNPSADGVNSRIYSANYSAGTDGWIIRNDGYAEFRQLAVNSIKVTAFDSPFQNSSNARMFDYMQDGTLWQTDGSVAQTTDTGAYSAESLFEFTGSGLVFRNGPGVTPVAFDPTILYRVSARVRAFEVATLNTNGTFEGGDTSNWTVDATNGATISASTDYASTGTYSMKMVSGASTGASYRAWTNVPVTPDYNYSFNFRVKAMIQSAYYNASNSGNIEARVTWFGSSGYISDSTQLISPPVDSNGDLLTAPTDWFSVGATFTPPADATNGNFIIRLARYDDVTSGTTIAYIDDVTVTTPPRITVGLFGVDNNDYIIDYDYVDDATTPTKKHALPTSDFSVLPGYASSSYMMVADNTELSITTGDSSTTVDWLTLTGYVKGRGGAGATGKFGTTGEYHDAYSPGAFNEAVRFVIPYVAFDIASGSVAQLDQFSIEAYENGAPAKVDTTGTSETMKAVSIDNIQGVTQFDHAIRFWSGEADEKLPGLIGHISDGDNHDSGHLRMVPPMYNTLSDYDVGPFIGIWDRNPNYIYNASFIDGIDNWYGMANTDLALSDTVGRTNSYSLEITATGTISSPSTTELYGAYRVSTFLNHELIGQQVTVSGYAMMGTATARDVRLVVRFLDESDSMISGYYIEQTVDDTDWVYYAFGTPVVVPDDCYNVEFWFSWYNGATGDIVYVDDVQLEAGFGKSDFRSASASKIELNANTVRSRAPIIIAESDAILPDNVTGVYGQPDGGGKPDAPFFKGIIAQDTGGVGTWRLVNYTDVNGERASAEMTFFGPQGDEQAGLRIYGLNDVSYPGQSVLVDPNGNFSLSTVEPTVGTPYDVRVYNNLIVDGDMVWTRPTLTNITEYDNNRAVAYAKNNGRVYLRGAGNGLGAVGSTLFTLPSGYRPPSYYYVAATGWNGTTTAGVMTLQIQPDGDVILYAGPVMNNISFDMVSFPYVAVSTPSTPGTDTTAPSAPSGFTISAVSSGTSTGSYKLSWTNPSASDTAGVKVIWRSDRYPTVTIAGSGVKTLTTDGNVITISGSASASKTYTHSGLPVNKTIYYRVVSYDGSGNHSSYVSASRYLLKSPITIYANSSDSYRLGYGGMWRNDGDAVYQGDWSTNDNHRGLWFYGSQIYSQLSTGSVVRTPTKMTIYMKRESTSHGNNSGVGINLRGHKYQSKPSGDPIGGMTNESSAGDNIVYLDRGEAATVTIPSAWYNNFVLATSSDRLEGLGVYGSSSSDYAIMYGVSSGSSHGKLTIYHKG